MGDEDMWGEAPSSHSRDSCTDIYLLIQYIATMYFLVQYSFNIVLLGRFDKFISTIDKCMQNIVAIVKDLYFL